MSSDVQEPQPRCNQYFSSGFPSSTQIVLFFYSFFGPFSHHINIFSSSLPSVPWIQYSVKKRPNRKINGDLPHRVNCNPVCVYLVHCACRLQSILYSSLFVMLCFVTDYLALLQNKVKYPPTESALFTLYFSTNHIFLRWSLIRSQLPFVLSARSEWKITSNQQPNHVFQCFFLWVHKTVFYINLEFQSPTAGDSNDLSTSEILHSRFWSERLKPWRIQQASRKNSGKNYQSVTLWIKDSWQLTLK